MQQSVERRLKAQSHLSRRRRLITATLLATAFLLSIITPHAMRLFVPAADASSVNHVSYHQPTQLSRKGAKFIANFEGFFASPYNDPVGHCTIGYGSLLHLGNCTTQDINQWGSINKTTALQMLRTEASKDSLAVKQLVKVRITQAQHDMLVSFAYNCGINAFSSSTLLKELNKGHYRRAANQLLRWNKADGQTFNGLSRRRQAERKQFLRH